MEFNHIVAAYLYFFLSIIALIIVFRYFMKKNNSIDMNKANYICYAANLIPTIHMILYNVLDYNKENNVFSLVVICGIQILLIYILIYGKKYFKKTSYSVLIVIISTYSLFMLSYAFSLNYMKNFKFYNQLIYEANNPLYLHLIRVNFLFRIWGAGISEPLVHAKYSMRYFFEYPPSEMLSFISIFQFFIGKIYDLILFGSVGNVILARIEKHPADKVQK